MAKKKEAMRYNAGKAKMNLVPLFALDGVADVLEMGAEKYAAWDWTNGTPWSQQIGCLIRHLAALQAGELYDPESGLLHSDHIATNAIFLSYNIQNNPEGNDLPKTDMMEAVRKNRRSRDVTRQGKAKGPPPDRSEP